MPQIDLDPKDYRGSPSKGEPVFLPGGPRKLLIYFLAFCVVLVISAVTYWPTHAFVDWLHWLVTKH